MARTYQVISGDGHLEIPPDPWIRHVPEEHRDRAPRLIPLREGGHGWIVEGSPLIHNGQNVTAGRPVKVRGGSYWESDGTPFPGTGDAAQRLREQDLDGIDAEVLYPPVFISRFIENIEDREAYVAMVRAYNDFLTQDYCSVGPRPAARQRDHPVERARGRDGRARAGARARCRGGVPVVVPGGRW